MATLPRALRPGHALLIGLVSLAGLSAWGDAVPQTLPFSQDWTNIGLITANDDWSGVPGVQGFLGQNITTGTGTDPQTLLGVSALPNDLDVIANQATPNTNTSGGVGEFDGIANPVVALQGSGTADAPHVILYLNTSSQTNVSVHYKLRDIDGSADNAIMPVALQYRVGNTGNFTNLPGGFVADATTGPTLATKVTDVCLVLPAAAENQTEIQVRVMTTNAVGNDEWVGIDDIQVSTAPCPPVLSINDVAVTEGDGGTVTAAFTVSLSVPAPAGGVTFDITTADGSATLADNDYVLNSLTGQTIPATGQIYSFNVTVNGDVAVEPNENFQVNITNVVGTGVVVGDPQGIGTINNDDVTLIAIHTIQGNGAASPLVGNIVSTRGIVTGVKSNGFFIQEPDATVDADPLTSEGVLVFTSVAPPPAAAIGNLVQVTGTVQEFIPSQDPLQPPLTELGGSPSVFMITSGNPLPAPIPLTATFPDPTGVHDQLERVEGMRVSLASLTVTGPTLGSVDEPNATATSSGVYYGVATGVARPFREAGIPAPDPAPTQVPPVTIPPIPRFDSNPERIRVDSDGLVGGPLTDVGFGAVVTGLVGPVDYTFRTYTILPDLGSPSSVTGGPTATPATAPTNMEFTVAGFNLERFFDTVDDAGTSDPVLSPTAFNNRLTKASLAIRNFLRFPDILGAIEVENLTTLQALAAKISTDAAAASQPDPQYAAFLVEGNDIGGIDVGFLVKTADVDPGAPVVSRVEVVSVTQENAGELFVNPDASTSLLNDRPTLRLEAVIHHPNGNSFGNLTVLVNHLRSLNGVNDEAPGSNGWLTAGARIRGKRQKQAESLANLIQACQTGSASACLPTIVGRRMVVLGDFNAFEVNDGLGHSMGVITGTPALDNETAVPGDGVDLVNPDLTTLFDTVPSPADHYSYVFDGNAQSLDHVLISQSLALNTSARRIEHPRIDADFPAVARNNTTNAERLSDHEPVVAYFEVADFPVELQEFSIE